MERLPMNKDELLEISKNFFGSVFQVENVSEKIRNLTYREVKKVFSAHDPRDLDCIVKDRTVFGYNFVGYST